MEDERELPCLETFGPATSVIWFGQLNKRRPRLSFHRRCTTHVSYWHSGEEEESYTKAVLLEELRSLLQQEEAWKKVRSRQRGIID